jgi:hypothetical protein
VSFRKILEGHRRLGAMVWLCWRANVLRTRELPPLPAPVRTVSTAFRVFPRLCSASIIKQVTGRKFLAIAQSGIGALIMTPIFDTSGPRSQAA